MRRRSLTGDGTVRLGSHRQSHSLSIRVSPKLAGFLEEERKHISEEIGVEASASEVAPHRPATRAAHRARQGLAVERLRATQDERSREVPAETLAWRE